MQRSARICEESARAGTEVERREYRGGSPAAAAERGAGGRGRGESPAIQTGFDGGFGFGWRGKREDWGVVGGL